MELKVGCNFLLPRKPCSPFPSEILISSFHLNSTHLKIVDQTPMELTKQRPVLTSILPAKIKPNSLYAAHILDI